ncbi:MAG TPA: hypothetical protein VI384_00560 [Candidatus Dormibacteraeota bacterium]
MGPVVLRFATTRRFSRAYLLIAVVGAAGCVFLLIDRSFYDSADQFRAAVECPDTNSTQCYQLYPGVIDAVRIVQTSGGPEAPVDVTSQGTTHHVTLLIADADESLLKPGAEVRVEWYTGNIASILLGDRIFPTSENPAGPHPNFAFVGGVLIWMAAMFGVIMLVNRRAAGAVARMQVLPTKQQVQTLAASPQLLSYGTGWIVRARPTELIVLPFALALVALASEWPLMNRDHGVAGLIGEAVLLTAAVVRLLLTLLNNRFTIDRTTVAVTDWLGRTKQWPLETVATAVLGSVRAFGWWIPAIVFIGRDGAYLLVRTSMFWKPDEILAACVTAGLPVGLAGDDFKIVLPISPQYRLLALAIVLAELALLAISILPGPPANLPVPPATH